MIALKALKILTETVVVEGGKIPSDEGKTDILGLVNVEELRCCTVGLEPAQIHYMDKRFSCPNVCRTSTVGDD